MENPSRLHYYLIALAAETKPVLSEPLEHWRRAGQSYGRRFRVAKAIFLFGIVIHGTSAYTFHLSSFNLGRLLLFSAACISVALYFSIRLIFAYEQMGFAESALFYQALMLKDSPSIDELTRTGARRLADEWQSNPRYQGWWRVKFLSLEPLRWFFRVLRERVKAG